MRASEIAIFMSPMLMAATGSAGAQSLAARKVLDKSASAWRAATWRRTCSGGAAQVRRVRGRIAPTGIRTARCA
jgi:hypothetical protein